MSARSLLSVLFLALISLGCSSREQVLAPQPLDPADLAGRTFNVVAKNANESVILLGQLRLGPIVGTAIGGTWDLRQWSGSDIPGLPGRGSVNGTVFGRAAILQLALPGTTETLGIVVDRLVKDRITGTISLLPSRSFTGSIEAIPAPMP
jgi:hypothetical protein